MDEPRPESPLSQLSVGENVVWAITRDRKVWFRNGIHGGGAGESEALARGIKWIEMVGNLQMISELKAILMVKKYCFFEFCQKMPLHKG